MPKSKLTVLTTLQLFFFFALFPLPPSLGLVPSFPPQKIQKKKRKKKVFKLKTHKKLYNLLKINHSGFSSFICCLLFPLHLPQYGIAFSRGRLQAIKVIKPQKYVGSHLEISPAYKTQSGLLLWVIMNSSLNEWYGKSCFSFALHSQLHLLKHAWVIFMRICI